MIAGLRFSDSRARTFLFGVGGSAVIYIATFAAVGVAADFRYGLWAVIAGLAGVAVAVADRQPQRRDSPLGSAISAATG